MDLYIKKAKKWSGGCIGLIRSISIGICIKNSVISLSLSGKTKNLITHHEDMGIGGSILLGRMTCVSPL